MKSLYSLLAGAFLAGCVPGFAGVPISVSNHSKFPVYATAVSLDQQSLCTQLGVPLGTPVSFVDAQSGRALPVLPGIEEGRQVARLYASLEPRSSLKLEARPAKVWSAPGEVLKAEYDPSTGSGQLRNGVLAVRFSKEGWSLGFDKSTPAGEPLELMSGAMLDCWMDTRDRGRMLYVEPEAEGLTHVSKAKLQSVKPEITEGGGARICFLRSFEGEFKELTLSETIELLPGSPVVTYRVRWENQGNEPRWIAYTKFGGGLKGRWGNLLAGSLLQRSHSPNSGFLLPSSVDFLRPSWMPKVCRVSFESESGVGLATSTLERIPRATGSMVWIFSNKTFQFNLLEARQGQFPFLIQKGAPVEAGFAFAATQTGVNSFPRAEELWEKFTAGKTPRLAPPCEVFVGEDAVVAQELGGLQPASLEQWHQTERVRRVAINLNFEHAYVGEFEVATVSGKNPIELTALPLAAESKPLKLGSLDRPGRHSLDFNKLTGWNSRQAFVLELKVPQAAAINSAAVAELPAKAPKLLSPEPDSEITDLATMFRWTGLPLVIDYELQLSRSDDFKAARTFAVRKSYGYPCFLPADNELPEPGTWFWRVRGQKNGQPGQWSEPRKMIVNNEHGRKPLKRSLTAANPLFTLEATKVKDYRNFKPAIPEDLNKNLAIVVEGYVDKGLSISEFMRGVEKLPNPIMMRGFGPGAPVDTWVTLADWEWAFQHMPNFVGVQGGESLSWFYEDDGAMRYTRRLLQLCAKHGMFYHEADGTYETDKWQDLMDKKGELVRSHGDYLVLTQKNNIIRRQFLSQSASLGLWLGGLIHQHGAWEDGGFYWQNAGFAELGQCFGERKGVLVTMPRIFWSLMCVMGMSHGASIYSLDGQTLMVGAKQTANEPRAALWRDNGEMTEVFNRYVVPLIRATVRHGLVPTKEEVLEQIRLAVYNDGIHGDSRTWPYYLDYGPLYAGTYGFGKMNGFDGQLWEFFPNTGRYFYIPVLPQGNEPLGANIRNLPLSKLQQPEMVREVFDAAYRKGSEGEALVSRVGRTLTVLNTNENSDITEGYSLALEAGPVRHLNGRIGPHAYVIGKLNGDGIWLQANTEYPERETELEIVCAHKPAWKVQPATAAAFAKWDEAGRQLKLRLSHTTGAVEVEISSAQASP